MAWEGRDRDIECRLEPPDVPEQWEGKTCGDCKFRRFAYSPAAKGSMIPPLCVEPVVSDPDGIAVPVVVCSDDTACESFEE